MKAVNTQCNYQNVDACWEGVAKAAGINTEKIKSCQKTEALDLLKKEVELNEKYNVQGSPMLIINGEDFNGPRTPEGYKSGICAAFNTAPEECSTSLGAAAAAAPAGGCAV
ncbi:thioredoxin domain-containing protein [Candidatus Woesearchaeota archaeon]|nr:thioredoxin domain-containing protein [Candidatus Woesearchaeota archaeon]